MSDGSASPKGAVHLSERSPGVPGCAVAAFVGIAVVSGLAITTFLFVQQVLPQAMRQGYCSSNLRSIAIALQNYEAEYQSLPPAYTVDAEGKLLHSWRTLLLPFMEQRNVYERIDLSKPWDDPANQEVFNIEIPLYRCPSGSVPWNHTTYLAVVDSAGCFRSARPAEPAEVTDNRAGRLLFVEVDAGHSVHWMAPTDADQQSFESSVDAPHSGGFLAVFADGHTEFLKAETLRTMISAAGHDDASP